jgi:hypothetical protein
MLLDGIDFGTILAPHIQERLSAKFSKKINVIGQFFFFFSVFDI